MHGLFQVRGASGGVGSERQGWVGPNSVESRDSHGRLSPTLIAALFTTAKRRRSPSVHPRVNGQTQGLCVDRTALRRQKDGDAETGRSAHVPRQTQAQQDRHTLRDRTSTP